jgi:hypothetical protein
LSTTPEHPVARSPRTAGSDDAPSEFPGQLPGERLIVLTHKHWLYYVRTIWASVIGYLAAAAAVLVLIAQAPSRADFLTWWFVVPVVLIAGASFWVWAMHQEWLNDIYIVSDRRVIALKKIYRIFEQRREIELQKMQDVTSSVDGVLQAIFQFGTVTVATAGASGGLRLDGVPKPERFKEAIFSVGQQLQERAWAEEQRLRRERLRAGLGAGT